jgi:seryl-tRNA synthetase
MARRSISEAREFGRLVEAERKPNRHEKLETLFLRVWRRDPKRWRSVRTMYRLWREFRADPPPRREFERRFALLDRQIRQIDEQSKRALAEFEERLRQVDAEFVRRNPHMAGWREHCERQLDQFKAQTNDALLKLPPQVRDLLRRPTSALNDRVGRLFGSKKPIDWQ